MRTEQDCVPRQSSTQRPRQPAMVTEATCRCSDNTVEQQAAAPGVAYLQRIHLPRVTATRRPAQAKPTISILQSICMSDSRHQSQHLYHSTSAFENANSNGLQAVDMFGGEGLMQAASSQSPGY
ncbi:hypothetical protein M422DRAFT_258494 [Sphaerobolus stellatus SS14]|uniref:Uncharacterized protein n=1 Tax=Sphaerobolus stellatus (strain SS14) TaxID=990650 RepID=A0A0C9VBF2_SPHS4|nr:hypothetical protein M422DRAFT_258494 [Sphaerobolus stellatus SS14]